MFVITSLAIVSFEPRALAVPTDAWRVPSHSWTATGRDECAGSDGDFSYWEWEDPNGECRVELTGWNLIAAIVSIGQVGCEGSQCIPECREIQDWLVYADIYEWTGWWEGEYFWDARWDYSDHVGFHWNVLDDVGLWAHEGSHGRYLTEEWEAEWYQWHCPGGS
jgi:hypothetical protein